MRLTTRNHETYCPIFEILPAGCSWCGGGEMFPKVTDKPKWIDMRTCVLPVALEPGKTYRIGINAPSFKNFRSTEGVPVVPVLYLFSTKE